uniref:Uncharacterized protein n=1 Tax=Rhizophora mucronata TaxID=61149 RepID=A0A2P2QNA2_RHIMU
MIAGKQPGGMSLAFSAPNGILGCPAGKGRIKVLTEDRCLATRGLRKGRFFGVTKMVMVRLRLASWLVKSISGIMWPCAGNGKINTCAPLLPAIAMVIVLQLFWI